MALRQGTIPPYLSLARGDVIQEPSDGWRLIPPSGDTSIIEDRSAIPGWDQNYRFQLTRSFRFPDDLLSTLHLPRDSRLELVVRMTTAGSSLATVVAREVLTTGRLDIAVSPDSATLSRAIHLESRLVLAEAGTRPPALAANEAGSVLWSSHWRARLEGGRARLPMETVAFSTDPRWSTYPRALFHVDVATDPSVDSEEGLCVYLNADFPAFVQAVESDDAVARTLLWEAVVRRCIAASLVLEVDDREALVPDSLGDHLRRWRDGVFPGHSAAAIRNILLDEPSRFEAAVQDWVAQAASLYADQPE